MPDFAVGLFTDYVAAVLTASAFMIRGLEIRPVLKIIWGGPAATVSCVPGVYHDLQDCGSAHDSGSIILSSVVRVVQSTLQTLSSILPSHLDIDVILTFVAQRWALRHRGDPAQGHANSNGPSHIGTQAVSR